MSGVDGASEVHLEMEQPDWLQPGGADANNIYDSFADWETECMRGLRVRMGIHTGPITSVNRARTYTSPFFSSTSAFAAVCECACEAVTAVCVLACEAITAVSERVRTLRPVCTGTLVHHEQTVRERVARPCKQDNITKRWVYDGPTVRLAKAISDAAAGGALHLLPVSAQLEPLRL